MATTMRSVDTRFWVDGWVRKLNALDRYVFLYFLTNTHSSWCGVYELDLSMAAFETGIDERDLEKAILPRLAPKIVYVDGWVCIKNFEKYHSSKSADTQKGIENAWKLVPEKIRNEIKDLLEKVDPLEGGSPFAFASTSSLTSSPIVKKQIVVKENYYEGFEDFWKQYPRKVAKSNALTSWNKMKPDLSIVLEAIEKCKKSEQWQKDDGRFIPHPATWLNQSRWLDEISEVIKEEVLILS